MSISGITLNIGTGGSTVRTDNDGTYQWQCVKLAFGADDTQTLVTSTSGLPVTLLASTAAIGKLAANSGVDIGDVGILSVPAPLSTTGGGTEATALRVTIASDSTGVLAIDDNGSSLTVDGTVTANLSATDNAVLDSIDTNTAAIKTSLELIDNTISGSGMQVDIVSDAIGTISTANSSTTPLAASATFTGSSIDTLHYVTLNVAVIASHNSAADGFVIAWSTDGTNWDVTESHTISAATGYAHLSRCKARYARVSYTNGSTEQTYFRLATVLKRNAVSMTYEQLSADIDDDHDAGLVRAVLAGKKPNGDYTNIGATANGNIKVSIEEQNGAADLATETTLAAVQTAVELIDNAISGSEMQVDVVGALPAGANLIGNVGVSGTRTSGGTTLYKNIDVDESEDEVKATAGQIYWIHAINLASSIRYLKIYNATAANVTVGTTVPDLTFPIPSQGSSNGAGFVLTVVAGIAFSTAITIASTTGVADNDTGAPGANEVIVNVGYA